MALIKCPSCGKEISPNADACPQCGDTTIKMNREAKGIRQGCMGCLVLACLLLFGMYSCVSCINKSPEVQKQLQEDKMYGNQYAAQVMAEDFLKRFLKTPDAAKFPQSEQTAVHSGNGKWVVHGTFDSQNSYGAMLRGSYICELVFQGNDSWQCESLFIDGKKVK